MSSQVWWYVTRSSGIVAWALLTASVLMGILIPAKFSARQRPAWLLDIHRWLGGCTIGFVVIHLAALVADSYVHFGLVDLVVPFASDWRPGAVALGVIATWILVVVEATSLAMRRLPRALWRWIHIGSYAAFFLVSLHGALAGTDATNPAYQIVSYASLGLVSLASVYRVLTRRRPRPRPERAPAASDRRPVPTTHGGIHTDGRQ